MTWFHSAIVLVLIPLQLFPSVAAVSSHIPLSRRPRGNIDAHTEAYRVKVKYGRIPSSSVVENRMVPRPDRLGKREPNSNITIPIVNEGGSGVLATVGIGTPLQIFSLILDTGSADLWVAGINCTTCAPSQHLYNFTNSSSFVIPTVDLNERVTIKYGTGKVSGAFSTEDISMGQFMLDNKTFGDFISAGQRFVSVDTISSDLAMSATQGIMGLAFTGLSVTKSTPFFQNLASSSDELTLPEFSFWIQRTDPHSPNELDPGGTFTIGEANPSFFTGDIDFLDLAALPGQTNLTFWLLNLATIGVNGKNVSIKTTGGASVAAIDTGTTLIGAPSDAAAAIWSVAGGKPLNDGSGLFEIPCSSQINVTLSFGGKTWSIDPQDMIFTQTDDNSGMCTGAIFDLEAEGVEDDPGTGNPSWIIGDAFLKNVYSVFRVNPPSIGFAQLSDFALAGAPGLNSGSNSSQAGGGSQGGKSGADKMTGLSIALCASLLCAAAMALL